MTNQDLGPLHVAWKTGDEVFRSADGKPLFTLLDFWRWSGSDLIDNTYRGVVAEFLVAKALGILTNGVRQSWMPFDLQTSDGIKIEVKSAAYVQSWHQHRLSKINFVVPKRCGFDANANTLEDTPSRHADVYVFALLAHQDKLSTDPLKLEQWRFYALSARLLDERERSQHSITLRSLEALVGPGVDFSGIGQAVRAALNADISSG